MTGSVTTQASGLEQGYNANPNLQIARNLVAGQTEVNIFGYNPAVTTAQYAVWENVADYVFPSTALTMTLTGTGTDSAQIQINGLDANYNPISETLTLNGSTGVTTVNQYLRINGMQVTAGSSTNPASTVTLTNGGVTYAKINTGIGATQMSIYTVPAGCTFYLTRIDATTSLNGNNAAYMNYRNKNIKSNGVVTVRAQSAFTQNYRIQRVMPLSMTEKTDIQFQCGTNTGTAVVGIFVEGYLVQN